MSRLHVARWTIRKLSPNCPCCAIAVLIMAVSLAVGSLASDFTKDYFIWDRDRNWNAAPAIDQALKEAGYFGDRSNSLPPIRTLLKYRTVWICLGVFPNADALIDHPTEINTLSRYLANNESTCVYMEGGDAWYLDPWTAFHDYFHIRNWGWGGTSDLKTLTGQNGTFAEGMSFAYHGDSLFIDRLIIDSTSSSLYLFKANHPDTGYGVMVAYDNGNCTYKTVASSGEFAGLTDGAQPSTRVALADSIMSFFCVPKLFFSSDVAATDIIAPTLLSPPHEPVTPSCQVSNVGLQTADSFYAHMSIAPGFYEESTFVSSLAPGTGLPVYFPDWSAGDPGEVYNVSAWTEWAIDERRANDSTFKQVRAWDDRWWIESPWCYNGDSVVADGDIGALEWTDAVKRDVSDFLGRRCLEPRPPGSAYLYVMNDSFNLYLALDAICDMTNTARDALLLVFEDNYDGLWPVYPDSSEGQISVQNWPPPSGPWLEFWPFFTDTSIAPYWIRMYAWSGTSSGNMQYECIIPLGDTIVASDTAGRHSSLLAELGDTVGFWMSAGDYQEMEGYAIWPTSSNIGGEDLSDLGALILSESLSRHTELEVLDIPSPPDTVVIGQHYPVTVSIRNNGKIEEAGFWVSCTVGDAPYVYIDSVPSPPVSPGAVIDVNLLPWHIAPIETTLTICAHVAVADSDTTNNRYCRRIDVVYTGAEELSTRRPPKVFSLGQNRPNPFTLGTEIPCAIPMRTRVTIRIIDITGSEVRALVNDDLEPRFYKVRWDGKDSKGAKVASGAYFYRIEAGDFTETRKMVVVQ